MQYVRVAFYLSAVIAKTVRMLPYLTASVTTASDGSLSHSDRKPLLTSVELRTQKPLSLAVIQKAKQSSAATIANISDDGLPFVHDAFECLTNHKAHVRPRIATH